VLIPQQTPKVPTKKNEPVTGFIYTALCYTSLALKLSLLNQSLDPCEGGKNPKESVLVALTILSILTATSVCFPTTEFSSFTIHILLMNLQINTLAVSKSNL